MKKNSVARRSNTLSTLALCIATTILSVATSATAQDRVQTNASNDSLTVSDGKIEKSGFILLTSTTGFMAREILALGAAQPSDEQVLSAPSSALAYAEIDGLDFKDIEKIENIKFLVAIGTPLLLESDSWNVNQLHAAVEAIFPGTDTSKLHNTGVLIRKTQGNSVSVEDTDFTPTQLMAGIPVEKTTEYTHGWSESLSEATAIHWSVRFAAKAYDGAPTDDLWTIEDNTNVYDIWRKKSDYKRCVVAWRGSSSYGDWIRDIQSMTLKQVPRVPIDNTAGSGFVDRLDNTDGNIRYDLKRLGCTLTTITGHSLGGAMAHVHTLQLMHDPDLSVYEMRAYNAARAFGSTAYNTFRNKLSDLSGGIGIYCRSGDPVNPVPLGLYRGGVAKSPYYGCTYWGAYKSIFNPISNHALNHWTTEIN